MFANNAVNDVFNKNITDRHGYKAMLLQKLNNLDLQICKERQRCPILYEDSSDSSDEESCEQYFSSNQSVRGLAPSVAVMRLKDSQVETCLKATEELARLHIVEWEANVLTEPPALFTDDDEDEKNNSWKYDGVWKEVSAECRADAMPVAISFFQFQPFTKPSSYHELKVAVVKKQQETELKGSILEKIKRPADAVDCLRRYSEACWSRRETLKYLAEKYTEVLEITPGPDGSFSFKCEDILQVEWHIKNSTSVLAPFKHRMKLDVSLHLGIIKKI